jgi:hypothetical protein
MPPSWGHTFEGRSGECPQDRSNWSTKCPRWFQALRPNSLRQRFSVDGTECNLEDGNCSPVPPGEATWGPPCRLQFITGKMIVAGVVKFLSTLGSILPEGPSSLRLPVELLDSSPSSVSTGARHYPCTFHFAED